jgi:glutamyl endopeptidase
MDEPVTSDRGGAAARSPKVSTPVAKRASLPGVQGQPPDSEHQPVSSESGGGIGGEAGGEEVAPDSYGEGGSGELERVPGFDESVLASEGAAAAKKVPIPPELENLPDAGSLSYETVESVCGSDGRVHITATTAVPWRWICQLIITFANGARARGTGWFIGPHTVMTAGHCVHSAANGGWAREIEVIPGMNATARPFGSQIGRSFRSVTGWTNGANPEFDYGAIILPNNDLGNRTGWFGFAALSDSSLNGLLINISGYAGDKPFGTQWFMAGNITAVQARRLRYMVDTFGGQSGSPVWRLSNGARHAVGIHAYGGCPNGATRITTPVFNNMNAWRS